MAEVSNNNRWYYISENEKKGIEFLSNVKDDKGVIAAYTLGNYIPAYTGKNVYFGHWIQTPNAKDKYNKVMDFYKGNMSDKEAVKFLDENNIGLIMYGNEEKLIGKLKYSFLKSIYKNKEIEIFNIRRYK